MSDVFHTHTLTVREIPRDPKKLTSKTSYEIVDQEGVRLAYAYRPLGEGGGRRFLRSIADAVMNSTTYLVEDVHEQPIMRLMKRRGQGKSLVSVSWANGDPAGTVSVWSRKNLRRHLLHDAQGRKWGEVTRPLQMRRTLRMVKQMARGKPAKGHRFTAKDRKGDEVARITEDLRRDKTRRKRYVSHYNLKCHSTDLPAELATLLRVATLAIPLTNNTDS